MNTNVIVKKVWEDDFGALFNVKFESIINSENFVVSGNFYLSDGKVFEQLSMALNNGSGVVTFKGFDGNFCELKISENYKGLKNINYHLFTKELNCDVENSLDVSINTGYISESAFVDRITSRLKQFYNVPQGCEISLIFPEE